MGKSVILTAVHVNWGSGKEALQTVLGELAETCRDELGQKLNQQLEAETSAWLGRALHQRRVGVGRRQGQAVCQRCGSRRRGDFSRNGHRPRQLQTLLGAVRVWCPRVVCQCGGSVALPLRLLQPYQRFWDDIDAQIGQWAEWGLSLRQMQACLSETLGSAVGLRRLNACVQAVQRAVTTPLQHVAPIVLLDAIWVTVLRATGEWRRDRRGRKRPVKHKRKVPLLVALGVWPSGQWAVLAWALGQQEDQASWEGLLLTLEARGVYQERGLALIVHDGNSGLRAALAQVYPHVPHQRCLFHKLRNLWQAIVLPETMPNQQARQYKRELLKPLRALLALASQAEMHALRDAFCRQWATTQPALVATLVRDWDETVAFCAVHTRCPDWPLSRLRTTSLLERVNRKLRRLFRPAGAFHSDAGLLAAAARVLMPYRAT